MYRIFILGALVGSVWALAAPWFPTVDGPSGMGHMMSGHAMGTAMTEAVSGWEVAGVTIVASTYYWHLVPGIVGLILTVAAHLASAAIVRRLSAVGLVLVGAWVLVGPWLLPVIGLGDPMMMGLTVGPFLRHVVPGILLSGAALGILATLPGRASHPTAAAARNPAEG